MAETFTYVPNYGASQDIQPRVKSAKFGDGYEQRFNDGINSLAQVWSLSFSNRVFSEINSIEDFLKARAGVEYFEWTPPRQTTPIKVICRQWQRQISFATSDSLTAKFEQVFDL
jgi:phage-related protein